MPSNPIQTHSLEAFIASTKPIIVAELKRSVDFDVADERRILKNAVLHSLDSNGKLVRPLLVLLTAQMLRLPLEQVMGLACAFEMVHTYSLIHDDLPAMDDDDLRRGKPTCHKTFGEDIAILAGDILNSYSMEYLITSLSLHFSAETVLKVLAGFAESLGIYGMAGGQVLDLKSSAQDMDPEKLTHIHRLKTGAILTACVTLTTRLSPFFDTADETIYSHLATFGDRLGLLFQVVDDLLDATQTSQTLGKTANKDANQDKLTFVSIYGLAGTRDMATSIANEALSALNALSQAAPSLDPSLLREFTVFISRRVS